MMELSRTVQVHYCEVHAGYPNDDWVPVVLSKNGYGKVLLKYEVPELEIWQHNLFIDRLNKVVNEFNAAPKESV